jgi:hypothetical protein
MQLLAFGSGDEGQLGTGREVAMERVPVKTRVTTAAASPSREWLSPAQNRRKQRAQQGV